MKVVADRGLPLHEVAWDDLARRCGSLFQSTLFDAVQAFFGVHPVYFSAFREDRLVGGVKLYRSADGRLPRLTRSLKLSFTQLGEVLVDEPGLEVREAVLKALRVAVAEHLRAEGAVSFRVSGVYGGIDTLLTFDVSPRFSRAFSVACVPLATDMSSVWRGLHKSLRTDVRKAARNGVALRCEDNIERLVELLDETYRGQLVSGPLRPYVRHAYGALKGRAMKLFFAVRGADYLAGALCSHWGGTAHWQFGGTCRQSLGAGAFLQWEIMKHYAAEGLGRYVLGQVAAEEDPANPRFSVGISRFKRHFGGEESPSCTRLYVLKPWGYALWTRLRKWTT